MHRFLRLLKLFFRTDLIPPFSLDLLTFFPFCVLKNPGFIFYHKNAKADAFSLKGMTNQTAAI